jgi:hypothetical protein
MLGYFLQHKYSTMPERTNDYFNIPLVNAIVIAWINPVRGEYFGDRSWYIEGRIVFSSTEKVIVNENGYGVTYTPKGYTYHNISNKKPAIDRFLNNVARKKPGARLVNFYDTRGKKPRQFLFKIIL